MGHVASATYVMYTMDSVMFAPLLQAFSALPVLMLSVLMCSYYYFPPIFDKKTRKKEYFRPTGGFIINKLQHSLTWYSTKHEMKWVKWIDLESIHIRYWMQFGGVATPPLHFLIFCVKYSTHALLISLIYQLRHAAAYINIYEVSYEKKTVCIARTIHLLSRHHIIHWNKK